MFNVELIALARAIHVMAGVAWAGAMFVLAGVIMPIAIGHAAEGAGRWTGMISRRLGMMSAISALFTILSGIYLFAVLHAHDSSAGGLVLKTGALAAVLSFVVGVVVGRPAGLQLAKLAEQKSSTAGPAPEVQERLSALRKRAIWSSRLTAGLLGIAVLSMAVFRYAQTMA